MKDYHHVSEWMTTTNERRSESRASGSGSSVPQTLLGWLWSPSEEVGLPDCKKMPLAEPFPPPPPPPPTPPPPLIRVGRREGTEPRDQEMVAMAGGVHGGGPVAPRDIILEPATGPPGSNTTRYREPELFRNCR